jgi:hypothetical protein
LQDEQFPHQSQENAIKFNEKMEVLIRMSGAPRADNIMFMDWWNLTTNDQTLDGMHSLSMDVNLAKAAHLLYLMERSDGHGLLLGGEGQERGATWRV